VVLIDQKDLLLFGKWQHVGDFILTDQQRLSGKRVVQQGLELEAALIAVFRDDLDGVSDCSGGDWQDELLIFGKGNLFCLVLEYL
jgi:hypothetical protein